MLILKTNDYTYHFKSFLNIQIIHFQAKDLMSVLQEANQVVNPKLLELAQCGMGFKGKYGKFIILIPVNKFIRQTSQSTTPLCVSA